ncbi:MAG: VCBS repeat-containing protein [Pseudobacteriovorax sp.]|nr:VCBS repeat-containing protein [Pseudobacteriovorax sp.]
MKLQKKLLLISAVLIPLACIGKKTSKDNREEEGPTKDPVPGEEEEGPSKEPTNIPVVVTPEGNIALPPVSKFMFGNVNAADGDDVVAFTADGVYVSELSGDGSLVYSRWYAGTLSSDFNIYPVSLADVDGNGQDDLVLFGGEGTFVALAEAQQFKAPVLWSSNFGRESASLSYLNQDIHPRFLADANADGKADILACHSESCFVAVSTGTSFVASTLSIDDFAREADGTTSDSGWVNMNTFPRGFADVDADSRADIIGFGQRGLWLSGNLEAGFTPKEEVADQGPVLALYGTDQGWISQEAMPRFIGDIDGDKRADIVGIKDGSFVLSLGQVAFADSESIALATILGDVSLSFTSQSLFLADVDGDSKDEFVIVTNDGRLQGFELK